MSDQDKSLQDDTLDEVSGGGGAVPPIEIERNPSVAEGAPRISTPIERISNPIEIDKPSTTAL
jgi:hypothetical protein